MLIKTWNNQTLELDLPEIKGNLLALPALIDPHVHFRTPGSEHKENWQTGAQAAMAGGYTTVFDMPNNSPSTISTLALEHKKKIIDKQLDEINIPLNYYLYLGATPNNYTEFAKCKNEIIGVKLFMGASTGDLLVDKIEDQENIFKTCAELNLIVAVHAESEAVIKNNNVTMGQCNNVKDHSKIRSRDAAITAVSQAIKLAQKYNTKLYICHVSTKEEIELIKQAKLESIKIYAEVTPHHLFLSEDDYNHLGTLGQMNPPLRTKNDQKALWQAILDGTIDTIGTDHAPHTLEEKAKPYPNSPSGVPGLETTLPLLLNEFKNGKITLEKITELTHFNIQKIFNIPETNDLVIIDLDLEKEVTNENLKTKCGWSPFVGLSLRGWPIATILNQRVIIL
ncbi:MAG TPA: dihydroorotase [Candidatus Magasanikbacteria bacterium]|nr:dihydroorotase [Candidatus Magasanikbacteria bacterium]